MLYVATLMFAFASRVFVPCLYSLLDLGSRDRVLGLCISLVLLGRAFGNEWGETAWAGSLGLSPCPPAFRQTVVNSVKEKEVGAFASNHSRVEREALGFSSLEVLSLQLSVPA